VIDTEKLPSDEENLIETYRVLNAVNKRLVLDHANYLVTTQQALADQSRRPNMI
jgi:hypothetical protein